MPSLLTTGIAWLHAQRTAHLTEPATYRRAGADPAIPINVTPSQVKRQLFDPNGLPFFATILDFIVNTADLGFEPALGDTITYNDILYTVAEFTGEQAWRYTDHTRAALRIHTLQFNYETIPTTAAGQTIPTTGTTWEIIVNGQRKTVTVTMVYINGAPRFKFGDPQ